MTTRPEIIAHRGASSEAIENSLEAFSRAIEIGADKIEFDVRRTRDDQLIAFHDPTLGGVQIGRMERAEIAGRAGHAPALLSEILELCEGRVGLDVELKEDGYVPRVIADVGRRFSRERVVITSFLDRVVAQVKELDPDLRAGLLIGLRNPVPRLRTRLSELLPASRARACGADVVAMHVRLAQFGALGRVAAAGLDAYVWTVNEPDALSRYLGDARVQAVITDDPALALELRDQLQPSRAVEP